MIKDKIKFKLTRDELSGLGTIVRVTMIKEAVTVEHKIEMILAIRLLEKIEKQLIGYGKKGSLTISAEMAMVLWTGIVVVKIEDVWLRTVADVLKNQIHKDIITSKPFTLETFANG